MPSRLFLALYVIASTGVFANLFAQPSLDSEGEAGTTVAFLAAWLIVYAVSLGFIVTRMIGRFAIHELFPFALCLIALASYFWSVLPNQTIRYAGSLTLNILFAWYCSRRFSIPEFLMIVKWTITMIVVIGLVLAAAGVESVFWHDGIKRLSVFGLPPIQGLFSHKIYAGLYSAIALVLHFLLNRRANRWIWSAVSLLGVLLSGSSIGLVAATTGMVVIAVLPLTRSLSSRMLLSCGVVVIGATMAAVWASIIENVTAVMGRDVTLTGRTEIWAYAVQFWEKKLVFGWGYGGIFSDSASAPGRIVRTSAHYAAPHFHNGFLQVAAELGTVGLLLFTGMLFYALAQALNNAWLLKRRAAATAAAAIMVMILPIMVVMNIGLRYNELITILIFYMVFAAPVARRSAAVLPRRMLAEPIAAAPLEPTA